MIYHGGCHSNICYPFFCRGEQHDASLYSCGTAPFVSYFAKEVSEVADHLNSSMLTYPRLQKFTSPKQYPKGVVFELCDFIFEIKTFVKKSLLSRV